MKIKEEFLEYLKVKDVSWDKLEVGKTYYSIHEGYLFKILSEGSCGLRDRFYQVKLYGADSTHWNIYSVYRYCEVIFPFWEEKVPITPEKIKEGDWISCVEHFWIKILTIDKTSYDSYVIGYVTISCPDNEKLELIGPGAGILVDTKNWFTIKKGSAKAVDPTRKDYCFVCNTDNMYWHAMAMKCSSCHQIILGGAV